jgi:cyclopropane fatty-acyl-phospholipid synthase-like methyltransferase
MNPNSPFFIPLPEPSLARHLIRQVRRGKKDATTDYWKEGKSQLPEEWAMQQHIYSFPLGFAMHDKGYFKNVRKILDVAGGAGSICIAIALNNPDIEIDMIELPRSIKSAQCMIARYDQSERIHTYGLNMFEADWPKGYDAVLFTNIYHDWKLEDCYQLTTKAHQSLKPGGKILIQEALLDEDGSGPLWIMHWSLAMILFTQGRQFKGSQVRYILEDCGFNGVTIEPVYNYYSTVSAFKPEY